MLLLWEPAWLVHLHLQVWVNLAIMFIPLRIMNHRDVRIVLLHRVVSTQRKNYCNDGDSVQRLFYDTVKGGDYRSREANVHRLAENSVKIIDHCVAQGVPFAREYGGLLDNRSFGGAQVSRTFYAKGQTGQQLLIGAYQAMMKEVERGTVKIAFTSGNDGLGCG